MRPGPKTAAPPPPVKPWDQRGGVLVFLFLNVVEDAPVVDDGYHQGEESPRDIRGALFGGADAFSAPPTAIAD